MSGTTPMPEASVSTDKPTLTQALGNDGAATPGIQRLPSPSDVSKWVFLITQYDFDYRMIQINWCRIYLFSIRITSTESINNIQIWNVNFFLSVN